MPTNTTIDIKGSTSALACVRVNKKRTQLRKTVMFSVLADRSQLAWYVILKRKNVKK
jgi:hypothetical protein